MRTGRVGRWPALLLALVLLAVLTACGSRRSHDELLAASRGGDEVAGPAAGGPRATSTTEAPTGTGEGALPGDGDGATATTTPGAGATTTSVEAGPSCTGDEKPLVVGSVGQTSGVVGTAFAPAIKAAQAWVAATNAKGGLSCHRVEYLVADDGGDPARQLALVRQLVEQKGVVAMLGPTASLTARASQAYLTSKRIPVIGGVAGPWAYESPMFFPASAPVSGPGLVHGTAEYLRGKGLRKVGVITCSESADCSSVGGDFDRVGRSVGLQVVYNTRASALQPDYTSVCQAAQQAGAEAIVSIMGASSLTRLGQSCARVAYHPVQVTPEAAAQLEHASDPNVAPLGVIMPVAPWTATGPEMTRFRDALQRYAPGVAPNPSSIQGWVWARLLEAAGQRLAAPTSAALLDGLYALRDDDLGGLTVPLRFTPGKAAAPSTCWWIVEGDDGRWASPSGGRRSCA